MSDAMIRLLARVERLERQVRHLEAELARTRMVLSPLPAALTTEDHA